VAFGSGGDPQQHPRQPPVEYVEFGGRRHRSWRWLSGLLLACLVIAALVVGLEQSGHGRGHHSPAQLPPISVLSLGHPVLGIRQGWQLFGLDQMAVVQIQLARGRVITKALPPAVGTGPVSFIVGPNAAIVRPLDNAPGYLVPDDGSVRPLTGLLASGGVLLPGPTPTQEWDTAGRADSLVLVGANGRATGTRITLPNPGWPSQSAMSDGRGNILIASDSGSQYDATAHSLRRIDILLSAVGPSEWLGMTCVPGHCRNVVLDPATGSKRTLPGPPVHLLTWPWPAYPGTVAPDGRTAAMVADRGNGRVGLEEIDLTTGTVTRLPIPVTEYTSSQTMAWSPDSRWLFVVEANGNVVAVSTSTHRVQSLGIRLTRFSQLVLRP
jgi:hypothetical protein